MTNERVCAHPFQAGGWYKLGELRRFAAEMIGARLADPALSRLCVDIVRAIVGNDQYGRSTGARDEFGEPFRTVSPVVMAERVQDEQSRAAPHECVPQCAGAQHAVAAEAKEEQGIPALVAAYAADAVDNLVPNGLVTFAVDLVKTEKARRPQRVLREFARRRLLPCRVHVAAKLIVIPPGCPDPDVQDGANARPISQECSSRGR